MEMPLNGIPVAVTESYGGVLRSYRFDSKGLESLIAGNRLKIEGLAGKVLSESKNWNLIGYLWASTKGKNIGEKD